MSKSNRVCSNTELGAPFFGNRFGEAVDSGFREAVVGLSGVAVHAGGGRDVYYGAWFAVGDAEIGGSFADELEGRGVVEGNYVVPLFVCHLTYVPRISVACPVPRALLVLADSGLAFSVDLPRNRYLYRIEGSRVLLYV